MKDTVIDEKSLHGRRILVVEDEPLIALELATILEAAGAEVVGPGDTSEEAVHFIEENGLDCALLEGKLKSAVRLRQRAVPRASSGLLLMDLRLVPAARNEVVGAA